MPTSQATIETDRPGRYLAQFCRHAAAMGETGGGHRLHGGHRPRVQGAGTAPAPGELRVVGADRVWPSRQPDHGDRAATESV